MSKHRKVPVSANGVRCKLTPNKIRYTKAAFAWRVGARQIAKTGEALYMYRCPGCQGGWHLTHNAGYAGSTKIETAAAPPKDAA